MKEDDGMFELTTKLMVKDLQVFKEKLADVPGIGELATDSEIKLMKDFINDLGLLVEKSSSIKHMRYIHIILMNTISILMLSPPNLREMSKITSEYVYPIITKKAREKIFEMLGTVFSDISNDKSLEDLDTESKVKPNNFTGLLDENGKPMTIEEIMKL